MTLEPHRTFKSDFDYVCMLTLSYHLHVHHTFWEDKALLRFSLVSLGQLVKMLRVTRGKKGG